MMPSIFGENLFDEFLMNLSPLWRLKVITLFTVNAQRI